MWGSGLCHVHHAHCHVADVAERDVRWLRCEALRSACVEDGVGETDAAVEAVLLGGVSGVLMRLFVLLPALTTSAIG